VGYLTRGGVCSLLFWVTSIGPELLSGQASFPPSFLPSFEAVRAVERTYVMKSHSPPLVGKTRLLANLLSVMPAGQTPLVDLLSPSFFFLLHMLIPTAAKERTAASFLVSSFIEGYSSPFPAPLCGRPLSRTMNKQSLFLFFFSPFSFLWFSLFFFFFFLFLFCFFFFFFFSKTHHPPLLD